MFRGTDAAMPREEAPGVLVLTRKANQSIMIGDGIQVSVLAVMGEKVRIGIEAPRSVPVFRKEVWVEIQRDQEGEGSVDVQKALEELKGDSARDAGEHLEHHQGHDDRGGQDRHAERGEASRTGLVHALDAAGARAVHGVAPQPLPAHDGISGFLPEIRLELRH